MSILFSKALFPGEVIADEWCVDVPIGEGGYAVIYSGYRLDDESPVVIKSPREGVRALDEAAYARFEREARSALRLEHPNIVKVIGYGHHGTQVPYIVMEALEGAPLSELRRRAPVPPHDAENILRQLLGALRYLHGQSFVHRDLKPGNVFLCTPSEELNPPYTVKLLDFGLVKPMEEGMQGLSQHITRQGHFVGTPGYVAPELFLHAPVTPAADVYGAGILGYEMLIGGIAFMGERGKILAMQQRGELTPAPAEVSKLPLMQVIRKMIESDPRKRFETCDEVLTALDAMGGRRRSWWSWWRKKR